MGRQYEGEWTWVDQLVRDFNTTVPELSKSSDSGQALKTARYYQFDIGEMRFKNVYNIAKRLNVTCEFLYEKYSKGVDNSG